MPNRADYQPLSQSNDEEDVGDGLPVPATAPTRSPRRAARPVHIDLSKLDSAFKRWTESIAQNLKRKKKVEDNSRKEIVTSVFEPYVADIMTSPGPLKTLDHKPPMTQADYDLLVHSVRKAIADGIHPKMISKGSSGSYFARAKVDGRVQTVFVFKPKDEEPYGRLNPKTTKWLHRQFRWIIPFGRACLIPNLSYVSEAAASLLDQRLGLHIVPRTHLVSLSSPAFFYDWIDRNGVKKGKPLPEKIGSMQYFLQGYTDSSDFLRKHPWPGRAISDTFDDSNHRKGNFTKRCLGALKVICGRTGDDDDLFDESEHEDERVLFDPSEENGLPARGFYWSQALQQNFREELEKLVILDYLMLNTDRGADNYMIKYCEGAHEKPLVDVAPSRSAPGRREMPQMSELRRSATSGTSGTSTPVGMSPNVSSSSPNLTRSDSPSIQPPYTKQPHIHIAAIDNSLSFPWEHPHGWRSYTYGWLYLPVSIVGRPFSEKTRNHFLPLLTSKEWWEETTFQLRKLFAVDPGFHPGMFRRQLAVVKGQAWNIVQSLKHEVCPLELTRRQNVLVWDDEVEVEEDAAEEMLNGPLSASIVSMPLPVPRSRRTRSHGEGDFPPVMRRSSTDASGLPRPVSFSTKFQRVHPATTGVTVLEHMERLDAVEAGLKRLGTGDDELEDSEEVDVGESSSSRPKPLSVSPRVDSSLDASTSPFSPISPSENLPPVPEVDDDDVDEEDLVALSKSTSHLDESPMGRHFRWTSQDGPPARPNFDWLHTAGEAPKKRTVIVERLETTDHKPFFSFW
ncbi:hypothetical protein JAAARDRAFT_177909 [Jaapia argillacea MUCL 33604]|uniref:Phosphatidylinositol 4-kinase n=1 Tax=Jaapia argillacea MUCL 33604 TaxID=933084 RepID=A0A067PSA0_9AGAM|nr:hypothetical protein JAAARDRAFT_177909 [Jaapia argillacea MUCL 33604]